MSEKTECRRCRAIHSLEICPNCGFNPEEYDSTECPICHNDKFKGLQEITYQVDDIELSGDSDCIVSRYEALAEGCDRLNPYDHRVWDVVCNCGAEIDVDKTNETSKIFLKKQEWEKYQAKSPEGRS